MKSNEMWNDKKQGHQQVCTVNACTLAQGIVLVMCCTDNNALCLQVMEDLKWKYILLVANRARAAPCIQEVLDGWWQLMKQLHMSGMRLTNTLHSPTMHHLYFRFALQRWVNPHDCTTLLDTFLCECHMNSKDLLFVLKSSLLVGLVQKSNKKKAWKNCYLESMWAAWIKSCPVCVYGISYKLRLPCWVVFLKVRRKKMYRCTASKSVRWSLISPLSHPWSCSWCINVNKFTGRLNSPDFCFTYNGKKRCFQTVWDFYQLV